MKMWIYCWVCLRFTAKFLTALSFWRTLCNSGAAAVLVRDLRREWSFSTFLSFKRVWLINLQKSDFSPFFSFVVLSSNAVFLVFFLPAITTKERTNAFCSQSEALCRSSRCRAGTKWTQVRAPALSLLSSAFIYLLKRKRVVVVVGRRGVYPFIERLSVYQGRSKRRYGCSRQPRYPENNIQLLWVERARSSKG